MKERFFSFLDLVADALSASGVVALESGDYLADLAIDYAAELSALPYCPERAAYARDSLAFAVEGAGGRVARFRRATRALGRPELPAYSGAAA